MNDTKIKNAQIIDYYRTAMNNGEKPKLKVMARQFGIKSEEISKLLDSAGLRARQERPKNPDRRLPKCPQCGAKADRKNACFCWKCGTDMRPTIDKAIEAMKELCTYAPFTGGMSVCVGNLCKYLEIMEAEAHR